jgi:exodeoxyribonuclease VII small subunit
MPAKKTGPDAGGEAPLDFKASLDRLERIVEELEGGELSLEDSIARYEEGVKLSRALTTKLDEAEKRIERLVETEGAGKPSTRPMELEREDETSSGELPF